MKAPAQAAARLGRSLADSWPPLVLAGIAFGGSFDHWVHLAAAHGQRGVLAPAIAVCVDLGVYMATRERQRDARIGRPRRGAASWPTLLLVGCIVLTLAGNVASAQRSHWGITVALIPGGFLLVAISLMERRAAEDGRRHKAAEIRRLAGEAAERQFQADLAAERERQEAAGRQEREAAERHAGRQAELARRRAEIVTGASVTGSRAIAPLALTAGPPAVAGAPGPGPDTTAAAVMHAFWNREVATGRVPTGADLMRAAGLDPSSSSHGRQLAARWRAELEGARS
jgi:hypothetical protein